MPNIIITNYCNLSCPYCFANDIIQTKKHNITLDELSKILNFLKKGQEHNYRIGIIGGEPTLHFKFEQIVSKIIDFSHEQNLEKPVIFSNGILLQDYSFLCSNDARVLLNLNHPKIIGKDNWEKIEKTLNTLENNYAFAHQNAHLGINLYLNIPDWIYILDIAKFYKQKNIRCSVVAPTNKLKTTDKFQYYTENKEIFLNFLTDAEKYNIIVDMDCNKIPLCYFTDKEQKFILKQTTQYQAFCDPVIDINYNLTAVSCFGTNIPVDITQFQNLSHLNRYFQIKQIAPLIEKNKIDMCQNCKKMEILECQGGCLSFNK